MADTSTLVQAFPLVDMATEFPKWLKVQAQLSEEFILPNSQCAHSNQTCVPYGQKPIGRFT